MRTRPPGLSSSEAIRSPAPSDQVSFADRLSSELDGGEDPEGPRPRVEMIGTGPEAVRTAPAVLCP